MRRISVKSVKAHIFILLVCFLAFCGAYGRCAEAFSGDATKWTVRQYGDGSRSVQSMFYTIYSNKGELAVIDGGWENDAPKVREVIKRYGNHVSAWIITHPHPDHVGALNAILKNNSSGIRIDRIYTTPVNRKSYQRTVKPWDMIEEYDTFRHLTRKMKCVVYLEEDDEIDLIGLNMKVLSSWDASVDRCYSANLCNYGSLMFKVQGKKKSMLFCGDIMKKRQNRIIRRHKKELRATYVQCSHHGNWGFSKKFYRYVKPSAAFFDSPAMITEDASGHFDAMKLIRYFKKKGVKVYTFANGNGVHTVYLR